MPIVARDLDVSERKVVFHQYINSTAGGTVFPGLGTGITYCVAVMPFPFEVVSVASSQVGFSGTPLLNLRNYHFIAGTGGGATLYPAMASSFALSSLGTSGPNSNMAGFVTGWSLPAAGATVLQGVAGDILTVVQTGSNAAIAELAITVVVKKLQDIASHFGLST